MTTYLRLRSLFRTVATSSLAVGAASCSHYDRADFDVNACDDLSVRPAESVDFVARRLISYPYDSATSDMTPTIEDTPIFGEAPCTAAGDEAACLAALVAIPTYPAIGSFDTSPWATRDREQFVFTRRDEVGAAVNEEQLRALFGAIDTAYEARWVADYASESLVPCWGTNARETPEGYELIVSSGDGCGRGDHIRESIMLVRPDGSTEVLDSKIVERGDPRCIAGRLTDGVSFGCSDAESVGDHLARMASLEATAVFAFARLAGEMRAFGAPEALAQRALDAANDELRHVAMVGAQARRFGGVMPPVEARELPLRGRLEVALENAREGMVRETYGALAGTYHAAAATDPAIAAMFERIAEDETRHAALSLDFGAWIEATLSDEERAQVAELREHAASTLADEVAVELAPEVHSTLGWPRPEVARELVARAFPAAWG